MLRRFRQHRRRRCDSGQLVRMFDWRLLDKPYQSHDESARALGRSVRFFTNAPVPVFGKVVAFFPVASIMDSEVPALPLHLGGLEQSIDSPDAMDAQRLPRAIRHWMGDSESSRRDSRIAEYPIHWAARRRCQGSANAWWVLSSEKSLCTKAYLHVGRNTFLLQFA